MDNPYICPTCLNEFDSPRRRKFCSERCQQSRYKPARTRADRDADRASRAADFRQRHAAGETLDQIAASAGISRQRIHQIITRN